MSEGNNNSIIRVLKLGDATYRQWHNTLIDVLEALELDEFISTFKYERGEQDPPFTRKEKNKIAKVRNIIKQSISKDDLEGLLDYRNPKEMLEELERKYRGPGAKSAWELMKDLETIKFEGSIPALFSRMRQLYAAFADKDIKLPYHIINSKVRSVLPPEYTDMCKMLDIYNGGRKESDYMSDKQFESELLRFDREKNLSKSSIQSTSLAATSTPKSSNANAATATNNIAVPSTSTSLVSTTPSNGQKFSVKCHFCGVQGHIERFCQQKKHAEMNRNNYRNSYNNNRNSYNNNRNGYSNNRNGYNNNRNGYNNDRNRNNNDRNRNNYNRQNNDLTSLSAIVRSSNQRVSTVSQPASLSLFSASSVKFLADCGASYHIVNDRSLLSNIRRTNGSISTLKGDIRNPEQGDMACQLFNGDKWIPMNIKDVFFVDEQPFNLIAIGKICSNDGIYEITNKDGMIIYHNRKPILVGKWSAEYINIIELKIRVNDNPTRNVANVAVDSLSCWHERFGHFATKTIAKMVRHQRVNGLPVRLKNDMEFCDSCHYGKSTDSSHPLENDSGHIQPGMKLHLDIGGYLDPSIHGNRYFLLAIDHRSRFVKVAFMKSRDQTLDKFKRIVNEVKLDIGVNVMSIRSDMGTEFCSSSFQQFLDERGIIHEKATVSTPQQNGRCERAMRTLIDHAISLLKSSNLPRYLWDEAINCSAYLMNRILNFHDEIPFEIYFGRKPNVSNLRIFGSHGQALIKNRESKFDSKTKPVIMVGYQGDSIYRVYVPSTRRIEFCSSVAFNEKPKCSTATTNNVPESTTSDDTNNDSDNFINLGNLFESDSEGENSNQSQRGRGRPIGSTNRQYHRDQERIESLRPLAGRNMVGICVMNSEPSTYEEAVHSEDSEKWKAAMDKEYNQLLKHRTWRMVERPNDEPIISVKWIYTIKDDGRYKARLVARGFQQKSNFLDIYAPVVHMDTIRLFFSIIATWNMDLIQFDCSNAFLNGDINETVYIDQPTGYNDGTNKVCLLQRGLYGLRQSPRSWNRKFDETIRSLNFQSTVLDSCLYFIKNDFEFSLLCVYVDDALLASNVPGRAKFIFDEIGKSFEIRKVEKCKFLGIEYFRNRSSRTVFLHQRDYLDGKLKMFNMNESRIVKTPLAAGVNPYESSSPNTDYPYRQAVGALLYLSCKTRPDIAYSVSLLSRFADCTTEIHIKMVKHLWRYLNGTTNFGILLGGFDPKIMAFSDADLAGDRSNGKTTTGHIIIYGGPILWRTKLQKCIIDNTSEAEFIAASISSKDILFLLNMLNNLGIIYEIPVLYCDNQATVKQLLSETISSRLRHVKLKLFLVRDLVVRKIIIIKWISTEQQLADILTKTLGDKQNSFFVSKLRMFLK